jgi:hypothetical protein
MQWMYDKIVQPPPSRELEWALNESEVTEEEFNGWLEMYHYTKLATSSFGANHSIPLLNLEW